MTTFTARIRPASRSDRSVLADVSAALRQSGPVDAAIPAVWTGAAELAVLLVTGLPDEVVIVVTGDQDAEPSTVRRAVSQRIQHAAGSRSAAAKLVITWAETVPQTVTQSI